MKSNKRNIRWTVFKLRQWCAWIDLSYKMAENIHEVSSCRKQIFMAVLKFIYKLQHRGKLLLLAHVSTTYLMRRRRSIIIPSWGNLWMKILVKKVLHSQRICYNQIMLISLMKNNMNVLLEYIKTHKNSSNCHTLVYVKASKIIHYNTFKTN